MPPGGKLYEDGRGIPKNGSGRARRKLAFKTNMRNAAPPNLTAMSFTCSRALAIQEPKADVVATIVTTPIEPRSVICRMTVVYFDEAKLWTARRTL